MGAGNVELCELGNVQFGKRVWGDLAGAPFGPVAMVTACAFLPDVASLGAGPWTHGRILELGPPEMEIRI